MAVALDPELVAPDEKENTARVVWALAWPAVALNSLQVINSLLDRTFIGHLEGAAMTAHGGALNVVFFVFSFAMSIATGATAIVSRAFGANNPTEVRVASRQALNLAWMSGMIFAGLTIFVSPGASRFILLNDEVAIDQMTRFCVAFGCGVPAIFIIQSLAASLRGVGDTKSPMVISGVQILLHIVLNYAFIFREHELGPIRFTGLGLGLAGAATALSTSAWIAAIGYVLYCGRTPLGPLWKLGLVKWDWAVRITRIAAPTALYSVLRTLSVTTFTLILARVENGSVAIAAMSVAFAVESIMFMPPFGLSIAAGALIGQSLGMGKPDRANRMGWLAAHHGAVVTFVLSVPIYIFAPQIAGAMLGHKDLMVAEAVTVLRLLCLTEVGFSYAVVLLGAMQGAGDTKHPLRVNLYGLWAIRVPLAAVLALAPGAVLLGAIRMPFGFGMGALGAWWAMSISQAVQGVMAIVFYHRGTWKTTKV
ncbi:MAG: MATE family efflux transporter [Fimbriimonas sp.]